MLSIRILYWTICRPRMQFSPAIIPHKEVHKRYMARNVMVVTLDKEKEELIRKQRRKKSRTKDRLFLCWVLWTNLKAESREGKTEVKLGSKSQRVKKRPLKTGWEHRKRFGLTGIINDGLKCSFKGLDLAVGSCWCHSRRTWQNPLNFLVCFFGKCCRHFSFPGQLEDEAIKSGPGILYCLYFFSAQQQGRASFQMKFLSSSGFL